MIKQKWILLVFSLFAITIITISAYAVDAAANNTSVNSSTKVSTEAVNVSTNYGYRDNWTHSVFLSDKSNSSEVQVRIRDYDEGGIGGIYGHSQVEVNEGDGWETWNFTECNPRRNNDSYDTFSMLTGPEPINFTTEEKVNVTPILDRIGEEEAQFEDVQHVTLYGIDDASVIEYYGYGDCWADACWLYNKLSAAGIPVRIMGYVDGGDGDGWRHTWIEINVGNGWETWNYTKYCSQHAGDNGYGTPYVLIGPGNAPADIMATGY